MSQYQGLAIRYHETGKPAQVIRAETIEYAEPQAGQALIKFLAAPIHPSDFGMIGGSYGRLRELPAVAGREGVGEIIAVGEGIELKPGQRVRMPEEAGVWQKYVLADAQELIQVPTDLPVEQAAQAFINPPTAWRILEDFIELNAGDWIIQNAANSAVGQCTIQLAKARGIRSINVVRDTKWEEPLKEMGADVVVTEDSDYYKKLKVLTGGAKPKLALNSVGGESVTRLIRCMEDGGYVVTFGGMVGDMVRYPTRFLIFNDVRLVGFWMDRWNRTATPEQRQTMYDQIFDAMRNETIRCPIDTSYPLSEYADALSHAASGGRNGKVIFSEA